MRIRAKTALSVAIILATCAGLATASDTSWTGNFETGNFSQYAPVPYCESAYSCKVVKKPVAQGHFAARFEVRQGDDYEHWSGERAQIALYRHEQEGTDSYWGWSLYLPRNYRDARSFFQVFAEWHHSGLTGSPPVTFQIVSGRLVIRIVRTADPARATSWDQYDLGPITPGRWTRFIYHARWSADPRQAVNDVFVNGMLRQHITGHPNLFSGYWNYLVVGWYRAAADITQVVYIDDVRVGNSLDSLDAIVGVQPSRVSGRVGHIDAFAPVRRQIVVIARDAKRRVLGRARTLPLADGRISLDLHLARTVSRSALAIELRPLAGDLRPASLTLSPLTH
jgi:Polysaccharide lyase